MSPFTFSSSHRPRESIALNWYLLGFKSNIMLISYLLCLTSLQHLQLFRSSFFIIHDIFPLQNSHLRLDFSFNKKNVDLKSFLNSFSIFMPFYRAVKFTSKLFGRALSRRIKATVLFASETGRSEQYAKQLVELLSHAFNAQVIFCRKRNSIF